VRAEDERGVSGVADHRAVGERAERSGARRLTARARVDPLAVKVGIELAGAGLSVSACAAIHASPNRR